MPSLKMGLTQLQIAAAVMDTVGRYVITRAWQVRSTAPLISCSMAMARLLHGSVAPRLSCSTAELLHCSVAQLLHGSVAPWLT
eukprot:g60765.t1